MLSFRLALLRPCSYGMSGLRNCEQAGANPDAEDETGSKPIHAAAAAGNESVVRLLLPRTQPGEGQKWTVEDLLADSSSLETSSGQPSPEKDEQVDLDLCTMYIITPIWGHYITSEIDFGDARGRDSVPKSIYVIRPNINGPRFSDTASFRLLLLPQGV